MTSPLDQKIEAWHAGKISDAAFYAATREAWARMAREIYRRWKVPFAVSPEDVLQELLLAAWRYRSTWEPGRAPVGKYIVWNARIAAKVWCHVQRSAHRHYGKSPSRVPTAVEPQDLDVVSDVTTAEERYDHLERWYALPDWVRDCAWALVENEGLSDAAVAASASPAVSREFGPGPTRALQAVRLVRDAFAVEAA